MLLFKLSGQSISFKFFLGILFFIVNTLSGTVPDVANNTTPVNGTDSLKNLPKFIPGQIIGWD